MLFPISRTNQSPSRSLPDPSHLPVNQNKEQESIKKGGLKQTGKQAVTRQQSRIWECKEYWKLYISTWTKSAILDTHCLSLQTFNFYAYSPLHKPLPSLVKIPNSSMQARILQTYLFYYTINTLWCINTYTYLTVSVVCWDSILGAHAFQRSDF